jgi:hypothetical protein
MRDWWPERPRLAAGVLASGVAKLSAPNPIVVVWPRLAALACALRFLCPSLGNTLLVATLSRLADTVSAPMRFCSAVLVPQLSRGLIDCFINWLV